MDFQFYFIKSRLSGLVLDIESGGTNPGAKVIPWEKHGKDNQLWYDDPVTGTIRSKLTNFCLDVEGKGALFGPNFLRGFKHRTLWIWERGSDH